MYKGVEAHISRLVPSPFFSGNVDVSVHFLYDTPLRDAEYVDRAIAFVSCSSQRSRIDRACGVRR